METLVALCCGMVGAWLVTRLVSLGNRSSRRVDTGYYVSTGYAAKTRRQCRSEFAANLDMYRGMVK